METKFKKEIITARSISDLWFQALFNILDRGRRFVIDCGSYEGQTRLEYDYFVGHIVHPLVDMFPEIPPAMRELLPDPVDLKYIYGGEDNDRSYIEYIMTPRKEEGEAYTYGERLTHSRVNFFHVKYPQLHKKIVIQNGEFLTDQKCFYLDKSDYFLNQIELIIATYKKYGHRNNQMVLQVAQPSDLMLQDPPCLRSIDTRIQDGLLHFVCYFRSWDLYGGLPSNLIGIATLQEYMAGQIGVDVGEMIVESKGLHIYGYAEKYAAIRCMKETRQ